MSELRDPLDLEFSVYAAEQLPAASGDELLQAQRLFMAGAQAVLTLQRRGVKAGDLQAELVGFGRMLGRQRATSGV